MKTKKYLGHTILRILILLPLIAWLIQNPLQEKFSSLPGLIFSLGQIAGLVGMTLFSLTIILSARLKIFEKIFKGTNEVYSSHHLMGGLAFSLLLLHPLLLAYNYLLVSSKTAALFLLPSAYWPQNYGIIALLIMIIALVMTFYMILKYQTWKFSHKFLGVAFIFAFMHIFLIGSDIAINPFLKGYFFILGILGITAFLYRAVFGRFLVKRVEYVVENVVSLPDNIIEIKMYPNKKELQFLPGQFVFTSFISENISKEAHPFSMSSSAGNPLKIAIKESGDYTQKIKNLKKGDKVKIEGPYGKFSFKNFNTRQVWIAGGIGITPFLSMARSLTDKDSDYKIDLYYSIKDGKSSAFSEELAQISKNNTNLKMIHWQTDERGFITADAIKKTTLDISDCEILVCGPQLMMTELKKQFLKFGIKRKKIHTEEFQLY